MARRWRESDRARIEHRRLWVERLFVRGLTLREIEAQLVKPEPKGPNILNPATGQGYDLSTISRDVTVIKERWKEEAAADVAEVKANQLAELREARRKAWSDSNVAEVRRNLSLETDLTGTKAPKAVDVTSKGEKLDPNVIVVRDYLAAQEAQETAENVDGE